MIHAQKSSKVPKFTQYKPPHLTGNNDRQVAELAGTDDGKPAYCKYSKNSFFSSSCRDAGLKAIPPGGIPGINHATLTAYHACMVGLWSSARLRAWWV